MLNFDVKNKRTVIVKLVVRITARHIREIEKAKLTKLDVPVNLLWATSGQGYFDTETGEVLYACNTEITEEILEGL